MAREFFNKMMASILSAPGTDEAIADEIISRTSQAYPGIQGNTAPATISDRGQAVVTAIRQSDVGGYGRTLARIFGASMGENLEAVYGGDTRESVSGEPGTIVIDAAGTTIFITDSQAGKRVDGTDVTLTDADPSHYTLPTKDQVMAFIAAYPDRPGMAELVLVND